MTVVPGPPEPITRLAAMGWRRPISLLLCVLSLAIAGCGSDDGTIPPDSSDQLLNLLAGAQSAIGEGECERAQQFAQEFVNQTENLPESVDPEVAEELANAGTNLDNLASDDSECSADSLATGPSGEGGGDGGPGTGGGGVEPPSGGVSGKR